MALGAKVIAVTHDGNSPLAQNAHYIIVHGFEANYAAKQEKAVNVLALAAEILNQFEGYEDYDRMQDAISKYMTWWKKRQLCTAKCKAVCEELQR